MVWVVVTIRRRWRWRMVVIVMIGLRLRGRLGCGLVNDGGVATDECQRGHTGQEHCSDGFGSNHLSFSPEFFHDAHWNETLWL